MTGDEKRSSAEPSYVLVARDYADIAHLENPNVIERILSSSRGAKVAYVSALLTSGLSRFALAGPKVAFAATAVEALTDFGKEVSTWIEQGQFPEDFSGRPAGYQTWVELLVEIDSNPVDAERLKAMKAMFLAANSVEATDAQSILAYHLFQIAKKLTSGELLLLTDVYQIHKAGSWPHSNALATDWRATLAKKSGHGLSALTQHHERALTEYGLITPIVMSGSLELVRKDNSRLSDLGISFCENIQSYELQAEQDTGQTK
jgi:hypothetical protein